MTIRNNVLQKIIEVFKKHGGECIDTPVFELKVELLVIISLFKKALFVCVFTLQFIVYIQGLLYFHL